MRVTIITQVLVLRNRAKAAMEIKEALSRAEQAEAKAKEEKLSIARNLKKMSLSPADIAKATGLSTDEVERL